MRGSLCWAKSQRRAGRRSAPGSKASHYTEGGVDRGPRRTTRWRGETDARREHQTEKSIAKARLELPVMRTVVFRHVSANGESQQESAKQPWGRHSQSLSSRRSRPKSPFTSRTPSRGPERRRRSHALRATMKNWAPKKCHTNGTEVHRTATASSERCGRGKAASAAHQIDLEPRDSEASTNASPSEAGGGREIEDHRNSNEVRPKIVGARQFRKADTGAGSQIVARRQCSRICSDAAST